MRRKYGQRLYQDPARSGSVCEGMDLYPAFPLRALKNIFDAVLENLQHSRQNSPLACTSTSTSFTPTFAEEPEVKRRRRLMEDQDDIFDAADQLIANAEPRRGSDGMHRGSVSRSRPHGSSNRNFDGSLHNSAGLRTSNREAGLVDTDQLSVSLSHHRNLLMAFMKTMEERLATQMRNFEANIQELQVQSREAIVDKIASCGAQPSMVRRSNSKSPAPALVVDGLRFVSDRDLSAIPLLQWYCLISVTGFTASIPALYHWVRPQVRNSPRVTHLLQNLSGTSGLAVMNFAVRPQDDNRRFQSETGKIWVGIQKQIIVGILLGARRVIGGTEVTGAQVQPTGNADRQPASNLSVDSGGIGNGTAASISNTNAENFGSGTRSDAQMTSNNSESIVSTGARGIPPPSLQADRTSARRIVIPRWLASFGLASDALELVSDMLNATEWWDDDGEGGKKKRRRLAPPPSEDTAADNDKCAREFAVRLIKRNMLRWGSLGRSEGRKVLYSEVGFLIEHLENIGHARARAEGFEFLFAAESQFGNEDASCIPQSVAGTIWDVKGTETCGTSVPALDSKNGELFKDLMKAFPSLRVKLKYKRYVRRSVQDSDEGYPEFHDPNLRFEVTEERHLVRTAMQVLIGSCKLKTFASAMRGSTYALRTAFILAIGIRALILNASGCALSDIERCALGPVQHALLPRGELGKASVMMYNDKKKNGVGILERERTAKLEMVWEKYIEAKIAQQSRMRERAAAERASRESSTGAARQESCAVNSLNVCNAEEQSNDFIA